MMLPHADPPPRPRARRLACHLCLAAVISAVSATATRARAENAIEVENSRRVDPDVDSYVPGLQNIAPDGELDAYPSQWSVKNGDRLGLRISTTAARVHIRIYRVGWYANSRSGPVGSRLMREESVKGERQPIPGDNDKTGYLECNWKDSMVLDVPNEWTPGVYFVRLTANTGRQKYTYFIVRDDARPARAPLLFVDSLATQQAYNAWPRLFDQWGERNQGRSLYPHNSFPERIDASGGREAVEVSMARPISENEWDLNDYTIPAVQWLERRGYDVAYANSIDLHVGETLVGRKAWMDAGHDEYWSMEMWDNLVKARDAGTSLAFFSGNDLLWQVRFEKDTLGAMTRMVGYKDGAYPDKDHCGKCFAWGGDPEYKLAVAAKKAGKIPEQLAHLRRVTYRWNRLKDWDIVTQKPAPTTEPVHRNPMSLAGLMDAPINTPPCKAASPVEDECHGVSWVVSNPRHWAFTGEGIKGGRATKLEYGDRIWRIVGFEMDSAYTDKSIVERPPGQVILGFSDEGRYSGLFNAQYYRAPSGAHVFSAGTIQWPWGLDRGALGPKWGPYTVVRGTSTTAISVTQVVSTITANVLNAMIDDAPVSSPEAPADSGPAKVKPEGVAAKAGCACRSGDGGTHDARGAAFLGLAAIVAVSVRSRARSRRRRA